MPRYKFELTATIEIIAEGENKEDARINVIDMRLFDSVEYSDLYVSDGEKID